MGNQNLCWSNEEIKNNLSLQMKKNFKVIAITVIVTVIILVGLLEIQKSNARAGAVANLKSIYPQLKSSQEKIAATIETNTIISQNKSWFGFSNSSANRWNEIPNDQPDMRWLTSWYGSSSGGSSVDTSWGYYDPSTGEFTQGR